MKFFRRRAYWYIGTALILVGLIWFFFLRGGDTQAQTLTVHPALFAQQISISGNTVAAQNVDLGFAATGRISGVYAKVGDIVGQGTVLAQVENGDLRAAVAQKQAALLQAQANLSLTEAGTRPEQIAVTQAQIDSDNAALTQANEGVVQAVQNAYTYSDDAVHNRADQFFTGSRSPSPQLSFTTSNSLQATQIGNERATMETILANWQKDQSALSPSVDLSGAVIEAQNTILAISQFLFDTNTSLANAVITPQTTQATVTAWIASIGIGRTNVQTAASALTTALTTEKADAAALAKDEKNLALQQAGSTVQDIEAQKAAVEAAQADVADAQAALAKTLVVAPFPGTVTKMDAKTGEIVSPGASEISMISNGLFQIQVYIPEVEIAPVSVGDPATTTLDAYGADVPFVAKVIAIDPAQTVQSGVPTYKTTLQFLAPDSRIKSGMTANVVITTRISPNAFVVPQGAVFEKGGVQVVQLMRGKAIADMPVTTGGTNVLGNVQVLSGLHDGDAVVLNPDTTR